MKRMSEKPTVEFIGENVTIVMGRFHSKNLVNKNYDHQHWRYNAPADTPVPIAFDAQHKLDVTAQSLYAVNPTERN